MKRPDLKAIRERYSVNADGLWMIAIGHDEMPHFAIRARKDATEMIERIEKLEAAVRDAKTTMSEFTSCECDFIKNLKCELCAWLEKYGGLVDG